MVTSFGQSNLAVLHVLLAFHVVWEHVSFGEVESRREIMRSAGLQLSSSSSLLSSASFFLTERPPWSRDASGVL